MGNRWDETWHRLREWTNGQGPAERLSGQVLYASGYTDLDPTHPLGGPDGAKDAKALKDGERWIMASYFPRGQSTFNEIKKKFVSDYKGVAANVAYGMAFVTNQELTDGQRGELENAVGGPVEIFHLERVAAVLDRPQMHPVRAQYLNIDPPLTPGPAITLRTTGEILDAAPVPPGAPDHRMLYDGVMLLRVVGVPVPPIERYPTARDPRATLDAASQRAVGVAAIWPERVSLLACRLGEGWESTKAHEWGAGRTTGDADALVRHSTAAVAFTTRDCAVCVDRTWATSIYDDDGQFAYFAGREPEVAAELVVALTVVGALLAATPDTKHVDIAMLLTAAPSNQLVSSERAVSGGRFGEPAGYLRDPVRDMPSYHLDSGRFDLSDVQAAYPVAEELLGPWLVRFRGDDLFQRLRNG
jgi:hypothetical protein